MVGGGGSFPLNGNALSFENFLFCFGVTVEIKMGDKKIKRRENKRKADKEAQQNLKIALQ